MPPIESVTALVDVLQTHGLLTREQLYTVNIVLLGRVKNPRVLGMELVQRGWLTMFQVNQVLKGNINELQLGPYRLIDTMGEGGSSEVYKAWHADQNRFVALKVVRRDLLYNTAAVELFQREMTSVARLKHPNVVQIVDIGKPGAPITGNNGATGLHYFAMEFLDGFDLGKLVERFGPPPIANACDYIRQAALGLQHAHEHCLVHRDMKPANLFLAPSPPFSPLPADFTEMSTPAKVIWEKTNAVVKILDWGLADLRLPSESRREIAKSAIRESIMGTVDYCAPEQSIDPETVDIRADIYSLGCTLYYVLTGQPPFPGGSLLQKVMRHQQSQPMPVESLRPEVPAGLAAVVRRMMEKQREKRFRTPAGVAASLGPWCRVRTAPAVVEKPAAPVVEEKKQG